MPESPPTRRAARRASLALLAALAIAASACDRPPPALAHGDRVAPAGGEEEPAHTPTHVIFEEAGGFEVFAEYDAPWVGAPTGFHAHFTELSSGRARVPSGLSWKAAGPAGQSAPVDEESSRAGVWAPTVRFGAVGTWRCAFAWPSADSEVEVEFEIEVYPDEPTALASPQPDEPSGITLLKEQQWLVELLTEPAREQPLGTWEKVPATVLPAPEHDATIAAPITGRVLPPEGGAFPSVGDTVDRGRVLARIEPPLSGADLLEAHAIHHELGAHEAELAVKIASARAEVLRTEAAWRLAESELERVRSLREADAKSQRELERAEYEARAARSAYDTAVEARKPYEEVWETMHSHPLHDQPIIDRFPAFELRAPIAGVVDEVSFGHGEHVEGGRALFRIIDATTVHIEASVPEVDVARLASSSGARLETPDGADSTFYDGLERLHVGLRVGEGRRVPIVYRAANPDGALRLGALVEVQMETAPATPRLSVPATAIVDDRGLEVVFVQLGGETFERRPIERGADDGTHVEITKGLAPGERVVTRGAYLVRLASLSGSIPEHHH